MQDETSDTSTAAENTAAAPEVQAESSPAQSAPPAQPETQAAPAATEPAPVQLTEHQLKFLVSRGYAGLNPSQFIANLNDVERAGFFKDAEAWQESDSELAEDEPAPAPVHQGPIVTGVVHKAPGE